MALADYSSGAGSQAIRSPTGSCQAASRSVGLLAKSSEGLHMRGDHRRLGDLPGERSPGSARSPFTCVVWNWGLLVTSWSVGAGARANQMLHLTAVA